MTILVKHRNQIAPVRATGARFENGMLYVVLSDGREIGVSLKLKWLRWLENATPRQRSKWTIDHWGDVIYWNELDDGIELCHLLDLRALTS